MNMNYEDEYMNKTGNKKIGKVSLWITLAFLMLFIGFCVYFTFMFIFFNPPTNASGVPGYITFTKDFQQRMMESLDVVQVRDWLNTLSESEIDKLHNQQFRVNAFPIELPNTINNLKSEMSYITIIKDDQYGICLRMTGGGPVGHWGVVIGSKKMPVPETEDVKYDKDGYRYIGEYRVKLEDGAYVWHEIK